MIRALKNFTAKKIGGLLLILVIIIAFGFGGFGGGFNIGNQNNIAKINDINISTQDFMDYLNESGLSKKVIKENIDESILEELLSALVSTKLLDLEIKDLHLKMPTDSLIQKIKKNKNFHDENGKFQRTLYEKFLLTNNMSAPIYEIKLKNNLLQKQLFTYISGGAKSPKFLVNKFYIENNKKLDIEYINLENLYKKPNEFSNEEIQKFVSENSDKLKQDFIDFSYAIISPKELTGSDDFNQEFFNKIDELDNKISKNIDFMTIINELSITHVRKKNYINLDNQKTVENMIYNNRADKIEVLEDDGTFILYQIDSLNTKLPKLSDQKFKDQIKSLLFQKNKYEFNNEIMKKINQKEFTQKSFDKLGNNEKINLVSIEDNKKFESNSVKILYSLPINSFTLISDIKKNIFIAKIVDFQDVKILENSDIFNSVSNQASAENRNELLKSYDYLLNDKYKVILNEKTLDRVKNYFR